MTTNDRAIALANKAISELEPYLNSAKPLREGMTRGQLATCRAHLGTMLEQLQSGKLPPKASRVGGMGRMIADSWPFNERLGDFLSEAELAYSKLP